MLPPDGHPLHDVASIPLPDTALYAAVLELVGTPWSASTSSALSAALHGALARLYGQAAAPSMVGCANNIRLSLLTGFGLVAARPRTAGANRDLLFFATRAWTRPPPVLVPTIHGSLGPAILPPHLPKDGLAALLTLMECTLGGASCTHTDDAVFAQFKERGFAKTLCRMFLNTAAHEVPLTILDSPYPSATTPPAAFIINTLAHNEALRTGAQTPAPPQEVRRTMSCLCCSLTRATGV